METPEQAEHMLKVIIDPASRTVLRVNQEPQSPILFLHEFLTGKQHEGWEVTETAPSGNLLLLILKRPPLFPLRPGNTEK